MPCFPSERLGRAAETCCEMLVYVIQTRAVHLEEGGPGSLAAPSFLPSQPTVPRSTNALQLEPPPHLAPLFLSPINFSSELTLKPEPD